jgi:regulator of sigma E protease
MLLTAVLGILVLGLLIFAHELGHFLVAKRNKIKVDEFGFGFPPRLITLGKRDGTEYTLNAIPFGGFVRLHGEDDPSDPDSFAAAPKRARAATLLAGAGMNFLVAILLFSIMVMMTGTADARYPGALLSYVAPDSPAAAAGLQSGDRIVAVNDTPVKSPEDLQRVVASVVGQPAVYAYVRGDQGRNGQTLQATITARANPPAGQGALGIGIGSVTRPVPPWEALWTGIKNTASVVYMTFQVPAMLISQGRPIGDAGFMGPVGITVVAGEYVKSAADQSALPAIFSFVALLSAGLGITQLLPIPALDGGRLLFVLIEAIRGRRVSPTQEGMVHLIGFALLLALIGMMTIREISSLISGTFPSVGIR